MTSFNFSIFFEGVHPKIKILVNGLLFNSYINPPITANLSAYALSFGIEICREIIEMTSPCELFWSVIFYLSSLDLDSRSVITAI